MVRSKIFLTVCLAAVVVIAAGVAVTAVRSRRHAPAAAASGCTAQVFGPGSSGHCVADIQTLVNMMQANKLIEACPFTGGAPLQVSGQFDQPTQAQVKVIQGWVNCYNQEEGVADRLAGDGSVGRAAWASLCTYGYAFPKRSHQQTASPYFQPAMSAGADAGCRL